MSQPTDEILALAKMVRLRTGLYFRENVGLGELAARLQERAAATGNGSLAQYGEMLRGDTPASDAEWLELITGLARNKSSFIRHHSYARILVEHIVPELCSAGGKTALRIWSAGCSTGEEPLMIAIALDEAASFERLGIEIHGTDGSLTAIEEARTGRYGQERIELGFNADQRERYFTQDGDQWIVKRELLARIKFAPGNIVDERTIAPLAPLDVIFCRNVFIYFSDEGVASTLHLFAKYMPDGGYLFSDVGEHFEKLALATGLFEKMTFDDVAVWRKRA